ncbi:hypothetical protein VNI00_009977 [Paramarasmius palmivorus]|uniref:Mid2 domain-containing protein n=1 Tax=Paramarasmius palmivorus TaxID=297713 RepID=A0AAW0CML3_9AGAR
MDLLGLGKVTQLTGDLVSGVGDDVKVAPSVILGDNALAIEATVSLPVLNLGFSIKADFASPAQLPPLPTTVSLPGGGGGNPGGGSTGNDPGQGETGSSTGAGGQTGGPTEGNGNDPTTVNTHTWPTNGPVPTNTPTVTRNPEGTSTPTGQSGGSGGGHGGNGGAQSTSAGSPSTGRSVPPGGVNPSTSPGAQRTATASTTRLANNIAASSSPSGDVEPTIVTSVVTTTNADGHPLTYTTKSTFTLSNPTSAPTSTTPPTSSSRSSNLAGLIGGIVAGIIILLILLALLIRYTRKRRARARSQRLLHDETTSSQAGIRSSYAATVSSLDFAPPTPRAVTRPVLLAVYSLLYRRRNQNPEQARPVLVCFEAVFCELRLTPVQEDANEKAAAQQEDARDPFADPSPRGQNDIETGMNPFADPLPAHHDI